MTHTPGPWHIGYPGIYAHWSEGSAMWVADVKDDDYMPDDEAKANARLIAAAPDLLEALEAILEETSNPFPNPFKDALSAAIILERARTAIAKAR